MRCLSRERGEWMMSMLIAVQKLSISSSAQALIYHLTARWIPSSKLTTSRTRSSLFVHRAIHTNKNTNRNNKNSLRRKPQGYHQTLSFLDPALQLDQIEEIIDEESSEKLVWSWLSCAFEGWRRNVSSSQTFLVVANVVFRSSGH